MMCAVADERSVRQGLVHAFVSRWTTTASASEASPINELEVMRGSAIECTLFSAMAIGGLMLGCPTVTVSRHLAAARQCLGRFRSRLCEQSAVAALILYGLANALLPPCDGDGQREYRSSMDHAEEIFGSLELQDPFVNAFMMYRGTCDNLVAFMPDTLYSVNPVNISGRRGGVTAPAQASTSGGGGGGEGDGDQAWKTPGGATTAGAKQGADAIRVSSAKPAHPAYVVADSMTLVLRFVCMEGDVRTGWANVHDLISTELSRLFKEQAGALVLTTLAGNLIAAKSRIGTSEGMLPVAEMVLAMFCKCPGLLRHYSLHNAHLALTAFRLYNRRKSFDALRALVVAATEQAMATFDEFGVGVAICSTDVCWMCSDTIFTTGISPSCGGGGGGGGGDGRRICSISSVSSVGSTGGGCGESAAPSLPGSVKELGGEAGEAATRGPGRRQRPHPRPHPPPLRQASSQGKGHDLAARPPFSPYVSDSSRGGCGFSEVTAGAAAMTGSGSQRQEACRGLAVATTKEEVSYTPRAAVSSPSNNSAVDAATWRTDVWDDSAVAASGKDPAGVLDCFAEPPSTSPFGAAAAAAVAAAGLAFPLDQEERVGGGGGQRLLLYPQQQQQQQQQQQELALKEQGPPTDQGRGHFCGLTIAAGWGGGGGDGHRLQQGRGGSGNDSLPVAAPMGLSSGGVGLGVTVETSAAAPPRRRRSLSPRHGGTSGTPKFMAAAASAAPVPSHGGGVASSDSRSGWEQFCAGGGSGSGSNGSGGGGGSGWTRRRDAELFDDSTPRDPWTLASGTAGGRSQAGGGGGGRDRSDGSVYGYPPLPGPHHSHVRGRLSASSPAGGGWAGSARASRNEAAAEQQHGFLDASSWCAPGGVDQNMLQSVLPPPSAAAAAAAAAAGGNGGRDFVKEPPRRSLWKQEGCPRGSESDEAMAIRIGGGSGGGGGGGGGEPQHFRQLQLDEAVNVGIGGGESWGAAVRGDDAGGRGPVVGDGTDQHRHVRGGGCGGGGGGGDGGGGEAGGAVCADLVGMLLDD
ncbi:unnamed protein product [Ectocarpus sp. CCAP 1310/34]|nr:unnamed protein product [Ectocarpus sp. CCAP 1310/34]